MPAVWRSAVRRSAVRSCPELSELSGPELSELSDPSPWVALLLRGVSHTKAQLMDSCEADGLARALHLLLQHALGRGTSEARVSVASLNV